MLGGISVVMPARMRPLFERWARWVDALPHEAHCLCAELAHEQVAELCIRPEVGATDARGFLTVVCVVLRRYTGPVVVRAVAFNGRTVSRFTFEAVAEAA